MEKSNNVFMSESRAFNKSLRGCHELAPEIPYKVQTSNKLHLLDKKFRKIIKKFRLSDFLLWLQMNEKPEKLLLHDEFKMPAQMCNLQLAQAGSAPLAKFQETAISRCIKR